jgi:hypothetical protein
MDADEFYEALHFVWDNGGHDAAPRSYSGRGMMGEHCIAVELSSNGELMKIGFYLGQHFPIETNFPEPRTDSMGMGVIAYWPGLKWNPRTMQEEESE